jgi:carbon storage regulator CsrA
MLILSRKVGEAVMIGDDVTIIVVGIKGAQIRLAIDAPRSVTVHREEVHKRIELEEKRQKYAAA